MLNFIHSKNWSRLLSSESDISSYIDDKRNVLFSQFCVIATVSAIIQGTYDLIDGFPMVMGIDLFIALILFAGYYLNEKRKHTLAKVLVFSSMNLVLFSFAAVVPKGVGIYLLFYPIVAFSFIALDFKSRHYSYGLTFTSLILNAILVITKYQPYGEINLQPSDPTISFIINLLISILLLGLGIDFMLKINHKAEVKLLENQRHTEDLANEINEKNLNLEKTNKELDQFVYSTSHDLRAPLASILGLINLTELEKDNISPEIRKYLDMMKDRVNNLDDFIQDIIDYSRNTRIDVLLTEVDVSELIEEVINNNRFLENTKKIEISHSESITTKLKLDRTRVFRVLNNLVSNAIKYNDLSKENPSVKIDTKFNGDFLTLEVRDTGRGIREEIKNKIFDMFYRGTDVADGSGLGLYIAKEMVEKMDGSIKFSSEPGKGTTFTIELPMKS
jgi:signal transduction histidine kinase